jgi:hypothetical protein
MPRVAGQGPVVGRDAGIAVFHVHHFALDICNMPSPLFAGFSGDDAKLTLCATAPLFPDGPSSARVAEPSGTVSYTVVVTQETCSTLARNSSGPLGRGVLNLLS